MPKKTGGFYAVGRGRNIGIFTTWAECESNVKGFPNAKFKKFPTHEEAEAFVKECSAHKPQANIPTKPINNLFYNNQPHSSRTVVKSEGKKAHQNLKRPVDLDTLTNEEKLTQLVKKPKREVRSTQLLESPVPRHPMKNLKVVSPTSNAPNAASGDICFLPFIVDSEDFVNVYTDGACPQNGQTGAQAGIGVWFGDNHPLNISQPLDGPATNNNAEIQAARLAIEVSAKAGFKKLKINTDSAFLIQCMTEYLGKWKKNNWRLSTGGDVKNRAELEKLDKAQQGIVVQWNKVPAHSGVHGNEMADKLAVEGAARYR